LVVGIEVDVEVLQPVEVNRRDFLAEAREYGPLFRYETFPCSDLSLNAEFRMWTIMVVGNSPALTPRAVTD
jgi:hypothetical protein